MTAHPDVAEFAPLIGGTEAGRAAAVAAAPRSPRLAELGGRTPIVVFDDIDPRRGGSRGPRSARRGGWPILRAGSAFFLVQPSAYDDFVQVLSARARTIRVGDPLLPTTQMGPLVSARQRDKVRALIDTGVAEGARLTAGGGVPDLPPHLRDRFSSNQPCSPTPPWI